MTQTTQLDVVRQARPGMWSAEGRVGRANYFFTLLVIAAVMFPVNVLLERRVGLSGASALLALPGILVSLYIGTVAGIKRLHDLGRSGWVILLSFVPLVNIGLTVYMLFWPGPAASNGGGHTASLENPAARTTSGDYRLYAASHSPLTTPSQPYAQLNAGTRNSASPNPPEQVEFLWASALAELEGSSRRSGLWARVFSEAAGAENAAKAAYLSERVSEMKDELVRKEVEQDAEISRQEVQRIAATGELAIRAYELAKQQKGKCPNCTNVVLLSTNICPHCEAHLQASGGWRPLPLENVQASAASIRQLQTAGFRTESFEQGWEIADAGGAVAAYAFTDVDVCALAQLSTARKPLQLWALPHDGSGWPVADGERRNEIMQSIGASPFRVWLTGKDDAPRGE